MLKNNEVPPVAVYNGEERCPFSREDDPVSRRQWFFEKAYADSPYTWDVPFRRRFHFTPGAEQYLYFRGEERCPLQFLDSDASTWWDLEWLHWQNAPSEAYIQPFVLFLRDWIAEKAAPNSGIDLEVEGNTWLDRYLKTAPL